MRALLTLIRAAVLSTAVQAEPPAPDVAARRTVLAGLSGSERRSSLAPGQWLETSEAPRDVGTALARTLTRQGFDHAGGPPRRVLRAASIAPTLADDDTINGGVAQPHVTFGGPVFDSDPAVNAKTGGGVQRTGIARLACATGHLTEAPASGVFGSAPQHDLGLGQGVARLCPRSHLTGWVFADGCLTRAASDRDLASRRLRRGDLALSSLFDTPAACNELAGTLAPTETSGLEQTARPLTLASVWTCIAVTEGGRIEGASRGASTPSFRDVRQAWMSGTPPRAGGFLGQDRDDAAAGLALSVEVRRGLTLEAEYAQIDSSVDFHDDRTLTFRARLGGYRIQPKARTARVKSSPRCSKSPY